MTSISSPDDRHSHPPPPESIDRRMFLRYGGAAGTLAGLNALAPGVAGPNLGDLASTGPSVLNGSEGPIDLVIEQTPLPIGQRIGRTVAINGSIPGPVLRFREGDEAVIRVTNHLEEDTSVHWHGILLPNSMDGVPKVNFPGIRPGETFEYRYPIRQYGTYWYHSHSGFQEQLGHYGAYVIDPLDPEPFTYDRDYVVVLSDWTFEDPHRVMARLKKQPDYFNFQQRTVADFFRDAADRGFFSTLGDRLMWGGMRMNPTDISDVTGTTYTYMVNGLPPDSNWTGLFQPGERVRLRFINAAAASYFDVRIPGLPMTVVQASGQHVQPVETDEFRIAIAETYDVIVEPKADRAYTIFAESMDRSGFGRGTLAPREGMEAPVPARRSRPTLTMTDMGMEHGGMEGMEHDTMSGGGMAEMAGHEGHQMPGALPEPVTHGPDHHGPGNAAVAMVAKSRLGEPGLGLGDDGWGVLRYTELRSLDPRRPLAPPERKIELHLTGNMERFMWSIDGKTFSEMELENGGGLTIPRVHTVNVKPAERISLLVTADAPGPWAFHCHILYHMDAGMFRVVEVVDESPGESAGKEGA